MLLASAFTSALCVCEVEILISRVINPASATLLSTRAFTSCYYPVIIPQASSPNLSFIFTGMLSCHITKEITIITRPKHACKPVCMTSSYMPKVSIYWSHRIFKVNVAVWFIKYIYFPASQVFSTIKLETRWSHNVWRVLARSLSKISIF